MIQKLKLVIFVKLDLNLLMILIAKKLNQNAKFHTVKNVLMAFAQFVKVDIIFFRENKEVIVSKFNLNVKLLIA